MSLTTFSTTAEHPSQVIPSTEKVVVLTSGLFAAGSPAPPPATNNFMYCGKNRKATARTVTPHRTTLFSAIMLNRLLVAGVAAQQSVAGVAAQQLAEADALRGRYVK